MPNTPNELAIVDSEWLQPDTFEKMLRTVPSILSSLSKLKSMLPKRGGTKRDPKKLAAEIDELRRDLETVCQTLTTASKSHTQFVQRLGEAAHGLLSEGGPMFKLIAFIEAQAKLTKGLIELSNHTTTIALGHERRIKALEASIAAGKGQRTSRKKSPALTAEKPKKKKRAKKAKAK
jgi:hypothetical protein